MSAGDESAATPARATATKRRATRTTAGVLTLVVLRDWRSRWDGVVAKVLHGDGCGPLQRSVGPGEIAVFTPTGNVVEVEVVHEKRNGPVVKIEKAVELSRTATRLVG